MNNTKIIKFILGILLVVLSFSIGIGINLSMKLYSTENVEAATQNPINGGSDNLSTLIVLNSLFNSDSKNTNDDLLRLIAVDNITRNGNGGLGELLVLNGLFNNNANQNDLSKLIVLYRAKY